jgi:hypothetical protein
MCYFQLVMGPVDCQPSVDVICLNIILYRQLVQAAAVTFVSRIVANPDIDVTIIRAIECH